MPQDLSSGAPPDTRPIHRLIRVTRWLLRSSWVVTGLGLTLGLLLGTLGGVSLFDALLPIAPEVGIRPLMLPDWSLRLALMLLVVVPTTWIVLAGVVRPLCRRLAAGQVARRIEAHIPNVHNRLVSCLDLDRSEQKRRQSPAFYRRLVTEALERVRSFRPSRVVDFASLRRAGLFSGVALAGFALAWLLFSDRLPVAMARIFHPFDDIPPRSGVVYHVTPETSKVLRGEDIPFTVKVEQGEPGKLWLELRSPVTGERLRYDLEKQKQDASLWRFTLGSANIAHGFEDAFTYRVFGGGTWSKQYRVSMIDRPRIVSHHTVLHYPEYMGLEARVGPPQTLEVTGPEGSQVEVVVEAEGQVTEGSVQMLAYGQPSTAVEGRPERVWFRDQSPAGAKAEGTWNWEQDHGGRPAHTEPPAAGTHGHWFSDTPDGFTVGPDDHLFADVYLPADQTPDAIMLEWQGKGWDHRAFWGDSRIARLAGAAAGKPNMGQLPPTGKWVRLEVPADVVGLAETTVKGMSFKMLDGKCYWGAAGVLPPVLTVTASTPMQPSGDNQWSGSFLLTGTGLYRVELRNELAYANKPMKEAKYIAIPDNPPQIAVEQPGTDLVLSKPEKVPLTLAAFDDFGLADVQIAVERGGKWTNQVVKRYDTPVRSDSIVMALDLDALGLKVGDTMRYHAEARDRKGQMTPTRDFLIRIAQDPNAADQQLAAFEKSEDPFQQKLAQLLAEQAKVRDAVEKLNGQYAPLMEKVQKALDAQADVPPPSGTPNDPNKPKTGSAESLKLDPEAAKLLQQLQKELQQLGAKEAQNKQLGDQVANDLGKMAEQMANLKMMPRPLSEEMQALQRLFQKTALPGLENLANRMNQGADPKQAPADLKDLQKQSERLQKELEAMRDRFKALADARKEMRDDVKEALRKLEEELMRQRGTMSEQDLKELRDFLNQLREQMKAMEGQQQKLNQATQNATDKDLPNLEKKQEDLDRDLAKLLDEARNLLKKEKSRRMKRNPDFPDAPYDPDSAEKLVPPKEEDTDEPLPMADKKDPNHKGDPKKDNKADKKDEDKDDPLFEPALGGPKPKLDPRFANKRRPVARKPKPGEKQDPNEQREDLQSRQEQQLQDLNEAQQSLQSDQQSLEQLMQQLQQAMKSGKPHPGQQGEQPGSESAEMARQLAQLMQSPAMREAMAMAARMRQGQRGMSAQRGPRQPTPGQQSEGNMTGSPVDADTAAELAKLDPAARSVILKMPPRVREDLLQGMREQGPEGYRKFIEDYFKRLTEVKSPNQ